MSTPEHLPAPPENNLEAIGEAAKNRSEQLRNSMELSPDINSESAERQAEKARTEALETAISVESGSVERVQAAPGRTAKRQNSTKRGREASFKRTMSDVQHELSAPSRVFSKVIHNKAIEATSEAAGNTIARPRAIVAGSFFALVVTFGLFMIAKFYGYQLSGFETIGAFAAGWAFGLIYDFLRLLVTGKK